MSKRDCLRRLAGKRVRIFENDNTGTISLGSRDAGDEEYDLVTEVGDDVFEITRHRKGKAPAKLYYSIPHILWFGVNLF